MAEEIYGNESISKLKDEERVRLRPAVIFGSDGITGCQHSIFEILSNSIDEAREGYGKKIEITRFRDQSVEVKDYGRGIPLDYNSKEDTYNWQLVFCELYAGGKYNNQGGENYEYSLGLNGLGACATQYASEYMSVRVVRDGYLYSLEFEKGKNVGGLKKEPTLEKKTGTVIKWRPDLEVFTDIDVPLEYYINTLKKQAVVNSGITFILKDEMENGKFQEYTFLYKDGITDYVNELTTDKALTQVRTVSAERMGRDRSDKPEYKVKMNFAFCFNNEVNLIEYYHNSSFLEYGGSPEKAVKNAFVYAIDNYIKQTNKYKANEAKITYNDVFDSLILVSNSFSTITSYENQTKKAITNKFIQEAMQDFLKEQLEIYFIENKTDAEKIAEQILVNKRSREQAEKAKVNIKKKLSQAVDVVNRVQKFVDCRTKDATRRELYIVEGDSALGSCKQGRDAEFQAIMPIRGKILNCLKAGYDKIFNSEIITDLMRVLGCGVEIKLKNQKDMSAFDLEKLRWDKIVICTDADVDGFQIRTLVLTMLYILTPTLIEKGKVYIAESPLYEINSKEKGTFFAYDEKEKADHIASLSGKYTLQRSKGLGENEPEMMWQTTMNPETRRLIKVMPEGMIETKETFELLLGDNLQGRKDYIQMHGKEYYEFLDIS
ncbi:MAG: DNA topoisomerase [Ruminococcaceae bacterium]|nr:DNA topoisomerase [Oscillospiraceae bacterium]